MKMDNEFFEYNQDDADAANQALIEAKDASTRAKSELSNAKKQSKKSFDKKIAKVQAKIEKMAAKTEAAQMQLSFGELADDCSDELTSAKKELNELLRCKAESQRFTDEMSELIRAAEKSAAEVVIAKHKAETIEKSLRPYKRYTEEIGNLEIERQNVGDTYELAKEIALHFDTIFGRGKFFIELQKHGIAKEEAARPLLVKLINETGIPPTVANDVHFASAKDKHKRDLVYALRFNQSVYKIQDYEGMGELYFKSNDEMNALFPDEIGQQGIRNTSRIAEMCNVYYTKSMHLPTFDAQSAGFSKAIDYLEAFSRKMIPEKYAINSLDTAERNRLLDKIEKRLVYELNIIEKMGYSSYFAIVQDFIFHGRKIGGPYSIGPGRGSAAGSIVCYLTDITDIDPLRYNLLFERFLNPERVSMPDIDTDIAPSIREKVIEYVAMKYAYKKPYSVEELRGTVCNIATEGELAARAAIKNVARVTDVLYSVSDRVAKMVPARPGITIKAAMEENKELEALYRQDIEAKHLIDDAMLVEGIPVQTGIHAAGVIISDVPISEYAPMFYNDEAHCWVIECDMVDSEATMGCLKMDFLGLKNLDIIKTSDFYIQKAEKVKVDFNKLKNVDDLKVIHDIYAAGDTNGIFQFEGEGIKKALLGLKAVTIDDVILMNAAYRPGPMQFISDVTAVKNGERKPTYLIPEMEKILGPTYGSAIYQEQIMQLFQMVGFSLGEADIIRRAMSKKHLKEIEAAKGKFVDGLLQRGAVPGDVEVFWGQLLEFAKYAFNRSHAAAYSVVSYYTAWLKEYHASSYMAALMSYTELKKLALYASDCKKRGIIILRPDINTGVPNFAPTKGGENIRYGLKSIKGVSTTAQVIYDVRMKHGPCADFRDLIIRACAYNIGASTLTSLVKVGAMDDLMKNGEHRREFVDNLDPMIESCKKALKIIKKDYSTLTPDESYELLSDGERRWEMPELLRVEQFSQKDILEFEHELLGMYISGSPVDPYINIIKNAGRDCTIAEIDEESPRKVVAGLVHNIQVLHKKSDGAPMAKFVLEDETGAIDVIMFTAPYAKYNSELVDGCVAKITGRISIDDSRATDGESGRTQLAVTDYLKLTT